MLQVDGSRHDWLQGRGRLPEPGWAPFDDASLTAPFCLLTRLPAAGGSPQGSRSYSVREIIHGKAYAAGPLQRLATAIFQVDIGAQQGESLEDQLAGGRKPHVYPGGLGPYRSHGCPVDSLWPSPPRPKGASIRLDSGHLPGPRPGQRAAPGRLPSTVEEANQVLWIAFLPRFNARFAGAHQPSPVQPTRAPCEPGLCHSEGVLCFKYQRTSGSARQHREAGSGSYPCSCCPGVPVTATPGPGWSYSERFGWQPALGLRLSWAMVIATTDALPSPGDPAG